MYELWQVAGDSPLILLKKESSFDKIYKEYLKTNSNISCTIIHTDSKKSVFIYESPDNGKTIYKRKFGDSERVEIKREELN